MTKPITAPHRTVPYARPAKAVLAWLDGAAEDLVLDRFPGTEAERHDLRIDLVRELLRYEPVRNAVIRAVQKLTK